MKLPEGIKSKITKNENGKNIPNLENNELVLVHCNIANSYYKQNSGVWYTFVSNRSFGELLDISMNSFMFLKFFDRIFIYWSMVYWSKF